MVPYVKKSCHSCSMGVVLCIFFELSAPKKGLYCKSFVSNIRNVDKSTWKWFLFTLSRKDYQIMTIRRPSC